MALVPSYEDHGMRIYPQKEKVFIQLNEKQGIGISYKDFSHISNPDGSLNEKGIKHLREIKEKRLY